jgi:hypothetical protein
VSDFSPALDLKQHLGMRLRFVPRQTIEVDSPVQSNEDRANLAFDKTRCICRACVGLRVRHVQADNLQEHYLN